MMPKGILQVDRVWKAVFAFSDAINCPSLWSISGAANVPKIYSWNSPTSFGSLHSRFLPKSITASLLTAPRKKKSVSWFPQVISINLSSLEIKKGKKRVSKKSEFGCYYRGGYMQICKFRSYARKRAVFLNSTMVTVYKNNEERK